MSTTRPPTKTRPMADITEYITTEVAAQRLGFHVIYIRRMLRDKKLRGQKIGPAWLVEKKSVDEYLKGTSGMDKHDPRRGK